jgi:hypothetical protein
MQALFEKKSASSLRGGIEAILDGEAMQQRVDFPVRRAAPRAAIVRRFGYHSTLFA